MDPRRGRINGAIALVRFRGPVSTKDPVGRDVVRAVRNQMLSHYFRQRERIDPDQVDDLWSLSKAPI